MGFLWFLVYGSRLYGSRFTAPDYTAPGYTAPGLRLPVYGFQVPPFHIAGTIPWELLGGSSSGPFEGDAVVDDVLRPS